MDEWQSYSQYFDILLPKSNSRRFSDIYFKIHGSTSSPSGINFRLSVLDIEYDLVRRTVLS